MGSGVLRNEPWLPDALANRLTVVTDDVRTWLLRLRHVVDEYDDWARLNFEHRLDEEGDDVFSKAIDDILDESDMLDDYKAPRIEIERARRADEGFEDPPSSLIRVPSFGNVSLLSDDVFLKPKPNFDVNRIFDKGDGAPVPPRRRNRPSGNNLDVPPQKPRPVSMVEQLQINMDPDKYFVRKVNGKTVDMYQVNRNDSDSGNNSPSSDYSDYQNLWLCTSGAKKPPPLKENYGVISTIRFDTINDISNSALDISKPRIVIGARQPRADSDKSESEGVSTDKRQTRQSCANDDKRYSCDGRYLTDERRKMVQLWEQDMLQCTSECDLSDDCHRYLADAGRKSNSFVYRPGRTENIYENVDAIRKAAMENRRKPPSATNSKTSLFYDDELNSSVEVISDSDSWRTPMDHGRTSSSTEYASESPIYENIQEIMKARPVTEDVVAWKALLLDPYWNDDEEDEWVSTEEASEYGREQNPPFVIPKIKPFKHKPYHHDDTSPDEPISPSIKDVRKKFEEGILNKNTQDYGKFSRSPPRNVGVAENYHAKQIASSPKNEASPIALRKHSDALRYNKAKSLMTTDKKGELAKNQILKKVLPNVYDPSMHVLLEGFVNRTKLTENGKKVRKSWQKEYAVMTQFSLAFYKDKKTYENSKEAKDKNSNIHPEAVISLAGALVAATTIQQTSRPNALVITSATFNQHLIYHEEPRLAQHWCDSIVKAINKLPSDYKCPENSNINQPTGTPSPTHKHMMRIKPNSKVTEGSVEDLTDLPEHAVIKSKLKKFFNRRPTMESLIKNKIYEDEPVFGRNLQQVCADSNSQIPEFVIRCIKAIESSEENMTSDGLYRASGNLSQVQKIRMEVNQNNLEILDKEVDVHVLTGTLKLFFRELKEPLIPYKLFQKCLNASSNQISDIRNKEFREIIDSLPDCNRKTLIYLLEHLLRVTSYKEKNRMHTHNIAIVLGPTLLRAPPDAIQNMAVECLQQNRVIELLMIDFDKIFKEEGKRKK